MIVCVFMLLLSLSTSSSSLVQCLPPRPLRLRRAQVLAASCSRNSPGAGGGRPEQRQTTRYTDESLRSQLAATTTAAVSASSKPRRAFSAPPPQPKHTRTHSHNHQTTITRSLQSDHNRSTSSSTSGGDGGPTSALVPMKLLLNELIICCRCRCYLSGPLASSWASSVLLNN